MTAKSSLVVLNKFLEDHKFAVDVEEHLGRNVTKSSDFVALPKNIVEQIIVDALEGHRPLVKKISQQISKEFKIFLGYVQKEQLKQYLDYQEKYSFDQLVSLIKVLDNGKTEKKKDQLV